MDRRTVPVLAAALAILPALLHAQAPPDTLFRLDQIVVTATGVAATRAATPAAVTIVRGDDLRRRGIRYVADALREVPGVSVARNGSTGGLTSVFLRGGESDYVQVLIDGVQANDPGGAFDFSALTTDDVERIEIVRGPVSVLYGSDAATGVIQIFTRQGSARPRLEASAGAGRSSRVGTGAAGAFGSWDAGAALTGGTARTDYAFSASRHETDGAYAFNNEYSNTTLGGRLRVRPDERTDALVTARWNDGTFHYPTNGAGVLVDANQFSAGESLALGLEAGRTFSRVLQARVALTTRRGESRLDDQPDNVTDPDRLLVLDDVRRSTAQGWLTLRRGERATVTFGGEAEWQSATNSTSSESSFGPFESASDNDRTNRAVFAQLLASPVPALHLTIGGRLDDNERFGSFRTYRVGANVEAARGVVLRAAAGTGFKEPTFYENFAEGFVTGNPSLQPERTRSIEAGAELSLMADRLSIGVTAYAQRFRNLIQYTFAPPDPADPNYFNIGEAESTGAEIGARYADPSGLVVSGSYERMHTEVLDEGFGADRLFTEGAALIRRPDDKLTMSAGWSATRWDARATLMRVGERDDLDFTDDFNGERVRLGAYTTADVSARFGLLGAGRGRTLDLIVRIDNLFDRRYEEIVHFPSLRRGFHIGLRTGVPL